MVTSVSTKDNKAVSRRRFLKYALVLGSAFVGALMSLRLLAPRSEVTPPEEYADMILMNGKVITVDPNDSIAEAVAIKDGRILATGYYRELKHTRGSSTREINLRGKTITPGLVDSHIHVHYYGKQFQDRLTDIRFPAVRTIDDLIKKVAERVNAVDEGEWVAGNQGFLFYTEVPDRWQLDAIAPDNPVFLLLASGQFAVANSMALKAAGINKDTPNPYGGLIDKNSTGEPTGFLYHYPAINMVRRLVPGIGVVSEEDEKGFIAIGTEKCLEAGYTSCQDVIISQPEHVQRYIDMDKEGRLPISIYMLLYVNSYKDAQDKLAIMDHWKGDNYIFAGWKIAVDGGPAAGTVLMYDEDTLISHRSYLYHTQEALNEMVSMFHKEGYQVSFHVGGDQAIDMALNAIENALQKTPRQNHRHRLEHVIFPTPEALERIKRLGVIVSTQPQWITLYGKGWKENMTEEQAKRFMPLRTMLDKGIKLAFGCDVPATIFIEPRYAFIGATTRMTIEKQPLLLEESISIKEALRAHTMGSAYAAFEEDIKGSIEPGKKADLVIWSDDLYSASLKDLWNMRVEATIIEGRVVYKSEETQLDL